MIRIAIKEPVRAPRMIVLIPGMMAILQDVLFLEQSIKSHFREKTKIFKPTGSPSIIKTTKKFIELVYKALQHKLNGQLVPLLLVVYQPYSPAAGTGLDMISKKFPYKSVGVNESCPR